MRRLVSEFSVSFSEPHKLSCMASSSYLQFPIPKLSCMADEIDDSGHYKNLREKEEKLIGWLYVFYPDQTKAGGVVDSVAEGLQGKREISRSVLSNDRVEMLSCSMRSHRTNSSNTSASACCRSKLS